MTSLQEERRRMTHIFRLAGGHQLHLLVGFFWKRSFPFYGNRQRPRKCHPKDADPSYHRETKNAGCFNWSASPVCLIWWRKIKHPTTTGSLHVCFSLADVTQSMGHGSIICKHCTLDSLTHWTLKILSILLRFLLPIRSHRGTADDVDADWRLVVWYTCQRDWFK